MVFRLYTPAGAIAIWRELRINVLCATWSRPQVMQEQVQSGGQEELGKNKLLFEQPSAI
jgi:hypothetical protein